MIHQTEGAEHHAIQRPQWPPGIEDHVRLLGHQRVVGKPRVEPGIRHLHDVGTQDGVAAKECSRLISHRATPVRARNHCRFTSVSETMAMGSEKWRVMSRVRRSS